MNTEEKQRLLELLSGIGSYNDKGIFWTNASPGKIADMRAGFRRSLDAFIEAVGVQRLPSPLVSYLQSEYAVEDGSGLMYETVEGMACEATSASGEQP